MIPSMPPPTDLFAYRRHWAHKFGPAPFLPMSREEMDLLGWDSCDIIIVTGDAYVDHPSFGMAVIGRVLEAQGFRVGIIAQPDWDSADDFTRLGRPNLYFGVTGGNMDSMVNRYTAERRLRSDDAYTPGGEGGRRPDRAVIVYSQRCREAYKDVPVVIGGIEASLRRIAHFDYWQEKVRRSVLLDAKADMLLFGNAERAIVELSHRLAAGESIDQIRDLRGTAILRKTLPPDLTVIDSTSVDEPGAIQPHPDPYADTSKAAPETPAGGGEGVNEALVEPKVVTLHTRAKGQDRHNQVVRLPSFEAVRDDPVLYAHASRVLHLESNPGNARALVQRHGEREVWINPPPIPLRTPELDKVFELPYQRVPHPVYGDARIPAYEMIRFSVNIMRGCFGGCSFCSITEHEGRIIQNRSEQSILREIENIRDHTPGFTGVISDLGGPTANMWRLHCKDPKIESSCRRLSCVLSRHLRQPQHRPDAAGPPVPQGARTARYQARFHRLGPALRHRGRDTGIRARTGDPPCRRLPEDRPGTYRAGPAVEDDEARHGHLRPLQGDVRQVLEAGRQGTVPDPLLHRRASRHHRRGHAQSRPVAEAQRLPCRPGTGLSALADGPGHGHVA